MTRRSLLPSRSRPLVTAVLCSVAMAACVSDGPSPAARQTPRPPEPQPAGIMPKLVDLAATRYARDSDKNGYADEIAVTAFLFAPPHNAPLVVPGEFRFSMLKLDGTKFGEWVFDSEKSAAAVERLLPGPGYRFLLSLLDHSTDMIPSEDVQLVCVFQPADGEPVRGRNPIRVTVGQLR